MIRFISNIMIVLGFLVVLGAVGDDCGGKCMENAMPLDEMIAYILGGFSLVIVGVSIKLGYKK